MNTINKIIKKHGFDKLNNVEDVLIALGKLGEEHGKFYNTMLEHFNGSSVIPASKLYITCPDCGCHTMLGFGECHLCGENLFDSVTEETPVKETKAVKEVKVEKKEDKKASPPVVDEDDFDLEDDDLEEEPKKVTAKKVTKKKAAKKVVKKEDEDIDGFEDDIDEFLNSDLEDDDDLDLYLD